MKNRPLLNKFWASSSNFFHLIGGKKIHKKKFKLLKKNDFKKELGTNFPKNSSFFIQKKIKKLIHFMENSVFITKNCSHSSVFQTVDLVILLIPLFVQKFDFSSIFLNFSNQSRKWTKINKKNSNFKKIILSQLNENCIFKRIRIVYNFRECSYHLISLDVDYCGPKWTFLSFVEYITYNVNNLYSNH